MAWPLLIPLFAKGRNIPLEEQKVRRCIFTKLSLLVCSVKVALSGWLNIIVQRVNNNLCEPVLEEVLRSQTNLWKIAVSLSSPTTTTSSSLPLKRVFFLFILRSFNINAHKCCSGWNHRCFQVLITFSTLITALACLVQQRRLSQFRDHDAKRVHNGN